MRTTLDISDDVLAAAKELARRANKTAGQVISELARKGLRSSAAPSPDEPEEILGFRPFSSRGGVVTNEIIDRIRDESGG
jgi:hypothetical protein